MFLNLGHGYKLECTGTSIFYLHDWEGKTEIKTKDENIEPLLKELRANVKEACSKRVGRGSLLFGKSPFLKEKIKKN